MTFLLLSLVGTKPTRRQPQMKAMFFLPSAVSALFIYLETPHRKQVNPGSRKNTKCGQMIRQTYKDNALLCSNVKILMSNLYHQ